MIDENKGYWVVKSGNCYINTIDIIGKSVGLCSKREGAVRYGNLAGAISLAEWTPVIKCHVYRVSASGKEYKVREPK